MEEEITDRGSMNRVWLVGSTIRRERGAHGETIAGLLRHLERRGFALAPRHLGVDAEGRDILTLIAGEPVPTLRGDKQLREVGSLLRAYHDAVADFVPEAGALWRHGEEALKTGEIVIHSDVAPWNLLEVDGSITGLVDWDTARPGRAVEDLAYAAWHFVPLHGERMGDGTSGPPQADRPRRLRLLLDSYGLAGADRVRFLSEVARMQIEGAARVARGAAAGDLAMVRHWNDGRFAAATARSLLWLDEHREALEPSLSAPTPSA